MIMVTIIVLVKEMVITIKILTISIINTVIAQNPINTKKTRDRLGNGTPQPSLLSASNFLPDFSFTLDPARHRNMDMTIWLRGGNKHDRPLPFDGALSLPRQRGKVRTHFVSELQRRRFVRVSLRG